MWSIPSKCGGDSCLPVNAFVMVYGSIEHDEVILGRTIICMDWE